MEPNFSTEALFSRPQWCTSVKASSDRSWGRAHVVVEAYITVLSALSSVLTNQLHLVSTGSLKRNGHKAMHPLVVSHITQNF